MGKMKALAMEIEEYKQLLAEGAMDEMAGFNGTTHEDMVNHPPHYNQGGIETIEAIKAALGYGFNAYLTGNILKYLWRYNHKGGLQDVKKAQFYLNRLVQEMDANEQVRVSGVPYEVARSSILSNGV
jgi:hypothetical protein